MKSLKFWLALVTATTLHAEPRFVTLAVNALDSSGPAVLTNAFVIGAFETAKLVAYPYSARCATTLRIERNGDALTPLYDPCNLNRPLEEVVVAGPAKLTLFTSNAGKGYCTFEILPSAYAPDKTFILPPGTNRVSVALECSTNLLNWIDATNGIYGSPTDVKFFRIKAEVIP